MDLEPTTDPGPTVSYPRVFVLRVLFSCRFVAPVLVALLLVVQVLLTNNFALAQNPAPSRTAFSQVDKEFPQVADAIASKDPSALQRALGKLPPDAQQRLLTVLHAQRIKPQSSSLGVPSGEPTSNPTGTGLLENPGGGARGAAGGGAIANFSELMSLIESTISPDVWLNAGGTATMSPFRQGVRITTDGVIERISTLKQSGAPKLRAVLDELAQSEPIAVELDELGDWQKPSGLRWISLRTLDEQLHAQIELGARSPIAAELLGGLCRIDYLAWDARSNDWLVGGPAGNLAASRQGDLLHRELRLPPVLLEDLLTVSHHVLNARGEFGCSIDPDPQRLIAAYQMANDKASTRLLARDPETWSNQWKKKLGFQKANIVGISQDSPTGYALLIADAHMKRLAFGLETSVEGLANYWLESERLGFTKEQSMVRWWFSMSQSGIAFDPDAQIYHFQGSNVAVLSETQMMKADGTRQASSFPDRAADAFAKKFTSQFDALQKAYPLYGRLRHIFDLAVVMEIVRSQASKTQTLDFRVLGKEAYVPHLEFAPTQIDSIVATRNRSDGSTSAIVSGGVSIDPKSVLSKLRLDSELKNRVSLETSPGESLEPKSPWSIEESFWK
ncbi:MAG: DUF1598 domain-containing protein [Planctomycetota bacterium]|nr:DUF1598 domain-containing protein [Planctomycetota bacterium]